ncbi:hypothetical protein [Oceanihabitans sediminis]|uniref:hypothetical protein n=1 Tax=Oceanihabitans sediminis TaxID=1812012 RepID=UPI00299F424C|nr:hypothetical protein [Oceanihabitans sediminis]MDX1279409.1 hypothetical protein [Oceanihabitans sediminis]
MAIGITVYEWLSPRIIEVDATVYTDVTVQELYNAIREWEDSDVNIDDDSLIDAAGKENLGGGVTVGITATLKNTRLSFKGNLTPLDDGTGRTCDTTDTTGRQLYVNDADFVTAGVSAGDAVHNLTTNEWATVTDVVDQYTLKHLQLYGQGELGWTSGDEYEIYENIQCSVTGGNLVAVDENGDDLEPIIQSPMVQVVRTSSSSATLAELDAIQYSSYGGGVSVDVVYGQAGTEYPIGNQEYPVNNLADAVTIANEKGFTTLFIRESMTIANETLSNFTLIGRSHVLTAISVDTSAVCDGLSIINANLSGTLDGGTYVHECSVGTINYVNGHIHNSGLYGTITLGGGADAVLADCYTVDQDNPVYIDMGGSGQSISMPNYSGLATIGNLNDATADIGIGLNAGSIVIDTDVLSVDNAVVSGIGTLVNNGSITVDTSTLISNATMSDAVWDEQVSEHATTGSTGKALSDAGVAGNPWSALAEDNNDPGTMGELMNTTKKWVGWLRSLL